MVYCQGQRVLEPTSFEDAVAIRIISPPTLANFFKIKGTSTGGGKAYRRPLGQLIDTPSIPEHCRLDMEL